MTMKKAYTKMLDPIFGFIDSLFLGYVITLQE